MMYSHKAMRFDEPCICGPPDCAGRRESADSLHSTDSVMTADRNNLREDNTGSVSILTFKFY